MTIDISRLATFGLSIAALVTHSFAMLAVAVLLTAFKANITVR